MSIWYLSVMIDPYKPKGAPPSQAQIRAAKRVAQAKAAADINSNRMANDMRRSTAPRYVPPQAASPLQDDLRSQRMNDQMRRAQNPSADRATRMRNKALTERINQGTNAKYGPPAPRARPAPMSWSGGKPVSDPRSAGRQTVEGQVLSKKISNPLFKRLSRFLARFGLRRHPLLNRLMNLLDVINLLMDVLSSRQVPVNGRVYPGYVQSSVCGPDPKIVGPSVNCGTNSSSPNDQIQRNHVSYMKVIRRAGYLNFTEFRCTPASVWPSYRSNRIPVARYTRVAGAPGLTRPSTVAPSLTSLIDQVKALDPALGDALSRAISPTPAADNPPFQQPAPVSKDPVVIIDLTSGGEQTVSIGKPHFPVSKPTPGAVRERKLRVPAGLGPAIFRALDKVSEGAEVVNAIWEALPDKCKKKQAKRGLVDQAGQYGIGGADWKVPQILACQDNIDWPEAIKNILLNEVEDRAYGAAYRQYDKFRGRNINRTVRGLRK